MSDVVWPYTSNVWWWMILALSSATKASGALKDRLWRWVNYTDPQERLADLRNWWKAEEAILRYGRNLLRRWTRISAVPAAVGPPCRTVGDKDELLETQTVDFTLGVPGACGTPGDIIEICDNDMPGPDRRTCPCPLMLPPHPRWTVRLPAGDKVHRR